MNSKLLPIILTQFFHSVECNWTDEGEEKGEKKIGNNVDPDSSNKGGNRV